MRITGNAALELLGVAVLASIDQDLVSTGESVSDSARDGHADPNDAPAPRSGGGAQGLRLAR